MFRPIVGVVVVMKGGGWLHKLREELHVLRVAVERFTSQRFKQKINNIVSRADGSLRSKEATLRQISSKFRVFSECYKVSFDAIVQVFR